MDEAEIRLRASLAGMNEAYENMTEALQFARSSGLTIPEMSGILRGVSEAEICRMLGSEGLDMALLAPCQETA